MEYHAEMKPNFLGKNLISFPTIDSTNNYATKLINETNIPNGTVILADFQTNGRGQRENYWSSEPGKNLTFSVIYFPKNLKISQQYTLNKTIAIGIMNFCNHLTPNNRKCTIKWPNDILIDNKKVSGILIENVLTDKTFRSSVIGIGLNLNQNKFPNEKKATSISSISANTYNKEDSLNLLLLYLEQQVKKLENGKFDEIDLNYLTNLHGYNQWRNYIHQGKQIIAKITGISKFGELELVTSENIMLKCGLKEIEFILD